MPVGHIGIPQQRRRLDDAVEYAEYLVKFATLVTVDNTIGGQLGQLLYHLLVVYLAQLVKKRNHRLRQAYLLDLRQQLRAQL
jgi:hypothetical protein